MSPKRQLLAQKNVSYSTQIMNVCPSVFAQLTLLPNPQNSKLYNAFQAGRHPVSAPSRRASTPLCNTFAGPTRFSIPNCISITSVIFAQLTAESPYTSQCASLKMQLYTIKKLIAVINAIKKLII